MLSVKLQNLNKYYQIQSYIITFFFCILPISLIVGNLATNINILLIDILFIIISFNKKYWTWSRKKLFLILIILWIYQIINSVFSINNSTILPSFAFHIDEMSLIRSLGFIRFVIFFFAIDFFFTQFPKILKKIFLFWTIILVVILFDTIFETVFERNIIGNISPSPKIRIASFFGDELVVGAYILGLGYLISGYLISIDSPLKVKKIIYNLILFLVPVCIFFSGERSNFIKASIIFFLMILFIKENLLIIKKKYIFLFFLVTIIFATFVSKDIYNTQVQFFKRIDYSKNQNFFKNFENIKYFAHYEVAWEIFKDNPVIGVGGKNFRNICGNQKYNNPKIKFRSERCSTHPHQVHFELLSEHGLIGYIFIISLILIFCIRNFKYFLIKKNTLHLASILYVFFVFTPLIPSGSIFATFNATFFWLNFSICYFCYKNKDKLIYKG